MPSKKLPPPPASSRGRPLPPEPSSKSDDVPPPLPSRPGQRHVPTMPAPPTPQSDEEGEDYLQPNDWSSATPPTIPPKNFSPESSDEEDLTYEEADAPAIPPPVVRQAPPPDPPVEQETYDEFEGMGDSNQGYADDPGETYDACDIQEESIPASSAQDEALYEEGDDMDDQLYEFVAEDKQPAVKSPLPPPAPSHPAPSHGAPSLPSRPPPSRHNDTESQDTTPELPGRPSAKLAQVKRLSGEGQKALGISLHELGNRKANLKKVESRDEKVVEKTENTVELSDADSVMDKINKFKQVEKGKKPLLPVKPNVSRAALKSKDLGPPPVPPSRTIGMPPPPPPPPASLSGSPPSAAPPLPPPPPLTSSSLTSMSSLSSAMSSASSVSAVSLPAKKTPETKSPPPVPSPTTPRRQESPPLPPPPPAVGAYEEDIYDEGFSYMPDPLNAEEWYHGEIERNDSNQKLQHIGQDGTFLVRKSKQGGENQPYTLVVLYKGHVYNLKMRLRNDGQIALGEAKADELAFKDVPALVQHHKAHDVILVNVKENKQYKTLLKKHPISMNGK